jgi:CrcB protein
VILAEVVAICLAGGVGAALRFVLDGAIRRRTTATFPLATMIINVTGSLVLGLLVGLVLSHLLSPDWELIIGTGMMGGYTTFSTASVESVRLLEQRRWVAALIDGFGMLILCTLAAGLGYLVGISV